MSRDHAARRVMISLASEPEIWDYLLSLQDSLGLDTVAAAIRVTLRQGMDAVPVEGSARQAAREAVRQVNHWAYGKLRTFFTEMQAEFEASSTS